MREKSHGSKPLWMSSQVIGVLAEHVNDLIEGWKDPIRKVLHPQLFPDMSTRLTSGSGRLIDQARVLGKHEILAAMPSHLVHLHDNEEVSQGM